MESLGCTEGSQKISYDPCNFLDGGQLSKFACIDQNTSILLAPPFSRDQDLFYVSTLCPYFFINSFVQVNAA
jgi:hypothetical protein